MQRRQHNGLFWGIFLLTLGVLYLLRNAGWMQGDWHTLTDLWPVLLILAGVNLILNRLGNPLAFVTTVMLGVAVPATLFGLFARDSRGYGVHWNSRDRDSDDEEDDEAGDDSDDDDDNESDYRRERERRGSSAVRTNTFAEAMTDDTREAVLKLSGGAGRFTIGTPSTELFRADTRQTIGSYSMSVDRDPTTRIPTVELKPTEESQRLRLGQDSYENTVAIHLNTKPVWSMDIGLGAGQGKLDLSAYAVRSLNVGAGAAELDLKLGARADQADIKLEVGAASVTVRVPKEVGCRIKKDGALNIDDLDDFTDEGGGEYTSPGYAAATKKMTIRFEGGISSFKVIRYEHP